MNVLQINTTYNSGSTGRIVSQIGEKISSLGGKSYVAYGRGSANSKFSKLFKVGSKLDFYFHALLTRIFDLHGFGSISNTRRLIKFIEGNEIDVIHLHNVHGYYLNLKILFDYLRVLDLPVVWTLHDCWTFTGHCSHFMNANCNKWETFCNKCPQLDSYPRSIFFDNSKLNFFHKKELFCSVPNLTLIPVSSWLEGVLRKSFLSKSAIHKIYNGIDLDCFNPDRINSSITDFYKIGKRKIVLGVANVWNEKKGYLDFISLSTMLSSDYQVVIIGLSRSQIKKLPSNVIGISRTEHLDDLVSWYTNSLVLFNPTYEDTYPTVNLESIACGTPVITYNTGGSPESITNLTGFVVDKGDLHAVVNSIEILSSKLRSQLKVDCRNHALACFDKYDSIDRYLSLYERILVHY